jgi:hypothetical protein
MNPTPDPPPPPMSDAVLDGAALSALFRDIGELAEVDEVIVKRGPGRVGDGAGVSLDEAQRLIEEGSVRGVQVRYRLKDQPGVHWWDTLMPTAGGVRLVRVRHEF